MKVHVSIIVPVYNAAHTLHRCIDSILTQTYTNFELLLIDDGSKDNSFQICDDYAAQDIRVRVFHQSNNGVSSARNLGMDKVQGNWITFIDSDDILETDYLFHLTQMDDVDMTICCGFFKNGVEQRIYDRIGVYNKDEIDQVIGGMGSPNHFFICPWGRMFKRSIIEAYHIRFIEGINYCEDACFNMEYLLHVENGVRVVEDFSYHYTLTGGGLSTSIKPYTHYYKCLQAQMKHYQQYAQRFEDNQYIEDYFIGFHLVSNTLTILQDLYSGKYPIRERKDVVSILKKNIKPIALKTFGYGKRHPRVLLKLITLSYLPFSIQDYILKYI